MNISGFSPYLFWSYEKKADLPDEVIIRQIVLYGEIRDMIKLTQLVSMERIDNTLKQLSSFDNRNGKRINFFRKVIF
jgi:hypothetical protein